MKMWLLLCIALVLTACSSDTNTENTTSNTTNGASERVETKVETTDKTEETAESTTVDSFSYPEDSKEFVKLLEDMQNWTSFKSNFSYFENYQDEEAIDTESYTETYFINAPREALKSYHRIGFTNQMYEYYANETDGLFTNDNMMGWEKSADSVDILKDSIPSRIELFKTLLANSEGFYTTGGDYYEGVRFEIKQDALDSSYFKIQTALLYNVIETEINNTIIESIIDESIDVTMILVEVHEFDERFGEYSIQVFFTDANGVTENDYYFVETFETVDTLTEILIPEELRPLL